jgi:hypothetical protein
MAGLPGCATVTTDDHQSVAIRSDPPGATCQVAQGGEVIATISQTPGTAFVGKSRHDLAINCTLPGYYPGAAVLDSHFQDMAYGNLLVGGLIGLLVDTSSGAIKEYPHSVIVLLDRQPVPGETPSKTAEIARETAMHRDSLRRGFD